MGQSAHVAERVSIPSSAVAVDGPANDHRSILVIDSPDNKPEDNAGAIENDPAPEQSARTSGRVFMNSIVSAASLAAAAKIAAPSLAEAETPANLIAVAVSVEPDPIYAAIEQFEEARANDDAALHAHDNAVKAFRGRHGSNFPNALTAEVAEAFRAAGYKGNASFFLRTHDEITAHKNGSFAEHIPFFHRTLNIQTNDYEKNVTPFEEAYEKADDNRVDAMKAVFETAPTTLAGLRAKIDFVMSGPDVTECLTCATTDEPLRNFLETLYESARLIAVQS